MTILLWNMSIDQEEEEEEEEEIKAVTITQNQV